VRRYQPELPVCLFVHRLMQACHHPGKGVGRNDGSVLTLGHDGRAKCERGDEGFELGFAVVDAFRVDESQRTSLRPVRKS
jgi:hypothetical protein